MSQGKNVPQVRLPVCTACHEPIRMNGYCSEGCRESGVPLAAREQSKIELHVFVLNRTEPFVRCWSCLEPLGALCLCDI